jgi:hypothetical protein
MEKKFLIDTNIVIYYTNGTIPENHYERVSELFSSSFNISTITKIEVLGWKKLEGEEKEKLESFVSNANVFYINQEIEQKTIELKRIHNIAVPDAIIGATALVYEMTLVTRNETDFKKIEGLEIYNPYEEEN